MKAIVTLPPYAPYIDEVLRHPFVSGIRLNTVMPVTESLEDVLERLNTKAQQYGKELWIDLKCRQLRIATYGVPPFTEIELTHSVEVGTPTKAYFCDGLESATVLRVDGRRLIMQDGPKRVVGPGESVNIPSPSLKVDGYLTETDEAYIRAAASVGVHNYMLSFVESPEDIATVRSYDPEASIIAKIESKKGMQYVAQQYDGSVRLMAARGDLFMELDMPHQVLNACETIVKKDPEAIAASRILGSLGHRLDPSCEDMNDVDNLFRMGYKTVMLGDTVCMERSSVMSALNVLQAIADNYSV